MNITLSADKNIVLQPCNTHMDTTFTKNGEAIRTGGIDVGPKVWWVAEAGNYILWYVPAHTAWVGRQTITPREYVPSTYYIVKRLNQSGSNWVRFTYECQPGKFWRKAIQLLTDYIKGCAASENPNPDTKISR